MRAIWTAAFLLLSVLGPAGAARANGVPHHDLVKITAIKEKGKVVGARIALTFVTNGERFPAARVGLLDAAGAVGLRGNNGQHGDHPQLFHMQFPDVKVPVGGVTEAKLELIYGKGNTLKPGQKIALISRWPTVENANLLHVWGDSSPQEIELPK